MNTGKELFSFLLVSKNLSSVDFCLLLTHVMTVADEVDAQLKQTTTSFMEQAAATTPPGLSDATPNRGELR